MESYSRLSRKEVSNIVEETVKRTLISLGVDADDPIRTQKAIHRLYVWSEGMETAKTKTIIVAVGMTLTVIGIVIAGMASWVGTLFDRGS